METSPKAPNTYHLTRWLFVRWMGIVYLIAFASLIWQIIGLYGQNGILPLTQILQGWRAAGGTFWAAPSLFWINAGDAMLVGVCVAGMALAVAVLLGVWPAGCFFILWFLYLSVVSVGTIFMSFQWDILLLEAGLLSVFFAPWCLTDRSSCKSGVSMPALWLLRLLLFKLMFQSGIVKLLSGDMTWHDLTALSYHYMTQPLPNPLSWYFYQLPLWFHRCSTAMMFCVELIIPFFIFCPRKLKITGFFLMTGLQVLILLTGNYTFFNLLTIGLCLLLLDDRALEPVLKRLMPLRWFERMRARQALTSSGKVYAWAHRILLWAWMTVIAAVSLFIFTRMSPPSFVRKHILEPIAHIVAPLSSVNSYGLFAVMTTQRIEIVVEGSDDGIHWKPYSFKYKPGTLDKMPPQVAPGQPRLDWQMWFAALTPNCRYARWFLLFARQLLAGSKDVTALLDENPFPGHPPHFLRALRYDYHFTSTQEKKETGNWWKQTPSGSYCPEIQLGQ